MILFGHETNQFTFLIRCFMHMHSIIHPNNRSFCHLFIYILITNSHEIHILISSPVIIFVNQSYPQYSLLELIYCQSQISFFTLHINITFNPINVVNCIQAQSPYYPESPNLVCHKFFFRATNTEHKLLFKHYSFFLLS